MGLMLPLLRKKQCSTWGQSPVLCVVMLIVTMLAVGTALILNCGNWKVMGITFLVAAIANIIGNVLIDKLAHKYGK
ncbi:MAG: hypothetical protein U9Q12_00115 [Patescibacteria group bacterium]|nr:hypothetical protein [Patescibacteria group bacterium]